jgi:hypothetical protein
MKPLILGATLSFSAAASQAAVALTGMPDTYAMAANAGARSPAFVTLMIALLLATWGAYALAASGAIKPLPFMQQAIHAITAIYLVRGLFLVPQLMGYNIFTAGYPVTVHDLAFSAVILAIGAIHVAGLSRR